MLRTADVEIDGHPVVVRALAEHLRVVAGVEKPEVIPARSRPLRHRVGLAANHFPSRWKKRQSAARTRGRADHRACSPRAPAAATAAHCRRTRWASNSRWCGDHRDADYRGLDRKVDGDGLAPVALPAEDPVAQLVIDLGLADPLVLEMVDDLALELRRRQAVELARCTAIPSPVNAASSCSCSVPSGLTTSTIERPWTHR